MTFKRKFIAATLAAVTLTGCDEVTTEVANSDVDAITVKPLAHYALNYSTVSEFNSPAAPGTLCVISDGASSGQMYCFEKTGQGPTRSGQPEILARFSINSQEVVEFTPASDRGMLCRITDGSSTGGMTCLPKASVR